MPILIAISIFVAVVHEQHEPETINELSRCEQFYGEKANECDTGNKLTGVK